MILTGKFELTVYADSTASNNPSEKVIDIKEILKI
jgi:hypothetical protein